MTNCTRCDATGFLNTHQLPESVDAFDADAVLAWIEKETAPHDVGVCDCCGDGEGWYSEPGQHDRSIQPYFDCM